MTVQRLSSGLLPRVSFRVSAAPAVPSTHGLAVPSLPIPKLRLQSKQHRLSSLSSAFIAGGARGQLSLADLPHNVSSVPAEDRLDRAHVGGTCGLSTFPCPAPPFLSVHPKFYLEA